MREENIAFIKMFVSKEMPYLEFDSIKERNYDEYGFVLWYKIKVNE